MAHARLAIATAITSLLLTACGSHGDKPAPAAPGPTTAPASASAAPAPAAEAALTEAECAQLINHIVDVGMDLQRKTRKPEEVPTEDQVAKIRAQMIHSMTPDCLRFSRASWTCAMAATTEEGLTTCTQPADAPPPAGK
jgi:hypothetical protein